MIVRGARIASGERAGVGLSLILSEREDQAGRFSWFSRTAPPLDPCISAGTSPGLGKAVPSLDSLVADVGEDSTLGHRRRFRFLSMVVPAGNPADSIAGQPQPIVVPITALASEMPPPCLRQRAMKTCNVLVLKLATTLQSAGRGGGCHNSPTTPARSHPPLGQARSLMVSMLSQRSRPRSR